MSSTTTTRAAGAPQFDPDRELSILALGDPGATPRRRAAQHRIPLADYLATVYPQRQPGPLAGARSLRAALARRRIRS